MSGGIRDNQEILCQDSGCPTGIRTGHFPDASLEQQSFSQPAQVCGSYISVDKVHLYKLGKHWNI
jgi:hypothetical protein